MRRVVLVGCACFLAAPVAAQTGEADKRLMKEAARAVLQERVRKDFEEAKATMFEEARKRFSGGIPKNEETLAIDGLKIIAYNKAYIYYTCIVSLGRERSTDKAIYDCVREPIAESVAAYNHHRLFRIIFAKSEGAEVRNQGETLQGGGGLSTVRLPDL